MTRAFLLLTLLPPACFAGDVIQAFGHEWDVINASDWKLEAADGAPVLKLLVKRPQEKDPRRPIQFALARTEPFSVATVEAEVKRDASSVIVVYAWRDAAHFNYAHLSKDLPAKVDYHNGIFHVYGGDRVRISPATGPAAMPEIEWYRVKLVYDAETGIVEVTVNGEPLPSLHAVDLSLGAGRVGLGSFFETGQFRNVRISGTR